MALKQSILSQIPQRNKDLAFGYTRESEKCNKVSIPDMIKYLCLIYLNQNKDTFDPNHTHKDIKIDENCIRSTSTNYVTVSCYLMNIVKQGIHIWKFKCNNPCTDSEEADMIGIVSNHEPYLTLHEYFDYYAGGANDAYGFAMDGRLNNPETGVGWGGAYGVECKIGDIIEMRIDFKAETLSYKINEKDYGVAFEIQNEEYRAAITLFDMKSCYTLISYQHIY